MELYGNRILVRFSKESKEGIFSKKIVKDDGTIAKLFINVPVRDNVDERAASLFTQIAEVVAIGDEVVGVEVGDIAITDYSVCNMESNLIFKDEEGETFWIDAETTYHTEDQIVDANRRTKKQTIVHFKGEIDVSSPLIGIIRKGELIAMNQYVLLGHEKNTVAKVGKAGILYQEVQRVYTREVLAVSERSTRKYGMQKGDKIIVFDPDCFTIQLQDKKIDAVNDSDCMANEKLFDTVRKLKHEQNH